MANILTAVKERIHSYWDKVYWRSSFNQMWILKYWIFWINKGNNKITKHRTILQRVSQNSLLYKQTKSVNIRKTVKTVMTLT
jgi:hypothetical protein